MGHKARNRAAAVILSIGVIAGATGCVSQSASPAHTGSTGLPKEIKDRGTLVIGSELSTPPIGFRGPDGKTVQGFNIDLARALGKKLHIKVTFQQYSFDGLVPAVRAGKVDAAMDLINDTPERRKSVDFVDYLGNGTTMLLKKGNPEHVATIEDLCGKGVAVVRGSVQVQLATDQSARCVKDGKKKIDVKQYAMPPDARLQVQTGKLAAFLGNTPVMLYLARTAGDGKVFETANSQRYQKDPIGMLFAKGDTQLRDTVRAGLTKLWADGTYRTIAAKYGLSSLVLKEPTVGSTTT